MSNSESKKQLISQCLGVREELQSNDFDAISWINEQLNIECLMYDTDKRFLGAEILNCCGGPDVRIDTRWHQIEGNWGGDNYSTSYECEQLDDTLDELYGSLINGN